MLLIITPEIESREEIKVIKKIAPYSFCRIHVRKPSFSETDMKTWLQKFNEEELNLMTLHQHHHLADEFGITGIHFKDNERKKVVSLNQLHTNKLLSAAFHNPIEAQNQHFFDYTLLSPVFNSISKKNYFGKEFSIRSACKPIIALGGITVDRIAQTKQLGYSGVAVLGSIWNAKDPFQSFQKIAVEYQKIYQNKI